MNTCVGLGMLFFAINAQAQPAAFPLYETFSLDPQSNSSYAVTLDDQVVLTHDAANDLCVMTTDGSDSGYVYFFPNIDFPGGGSTDFSVSVEVENSSAWNQSYVKALAENAERNSGYDAYLRGADEIAIRRDGVKVASAAWTNQVSGEFNIKLTGRYSVSGELTLTLVVKDRTTHGQELTWVDSDPLSGSHFGYVGRVINNSELILDSFLAARPSVIAPFYDVFAEDPASYGRDYTLTKSDSLVFSHALSDVYSNHLWVGETDGSASGNFDLYTEVPNLGGTNQAGFTVSLKVNNESAWNQNYVNVLALSAGLGTGYDALLRGADKISIRKEGQEVVSASWTNAQSGIFYLTLSGEYSNSEMLHLTFTVMDESGNSQQINYEDSDPLTGQTFGVAGRIINNYSMAVDSFLISTPAPDSFLTSFNESFQEDPTLDSDYVITQSSQIIMEHDDQLNVWQASTEEGASGTFSLFTSGSVVLSSRTDAGFVMAVEFDSSSGWNQGHLMALSESNSFNSGYGAYIRPADSVAIRRDGVVVASADWSNSTVGRYSLSLRGTYTEEGSLKLTLVLTDQNFQTQTLSFTDESPLAGDRFGVYGRVVTNQELTLEKWSLASHSGREKLLVSDLDIDRVRQSAFVDPLMGQLFDCMNIKALAYAEDAALTNYTDHSNLIKEARRGIGKILSGAYRFRLTGETEFADAAISTMLNISTFSKWYDDEFLCGAEMGFGMAVGYSWLYDVMTDEERSVVRAAIVDKALGQVPDAYSDPANSVPTGWKAFNGSFLGENNVSQIVNSGYLSLALSLQEEESDLMDQTLKGAVRSLANAMTNLGPDGVWPEGPTYCDYGLSYNVIALDLLEKTYGTSFGLTEISGVGQAAEAFVGHLFGPRKKGFNFADCAQSSSTAIIGTHPEFTWLAERYDQEQVMLTERGWLQTRLEGLPLPLEGTWEYSNNRFMVLHSVWFPRDIQSPVEDFPLDAKFDGVADVAVFKSSADDENALWVGFKGGENGWSHGHLDLGSFVLESDGVRWAVDLGPDNYGLPGYFQYTSSGLRWDYFRCSSLSHNTVSLGGGLQDPAAEADIIEYQSSSTNAFAVMDLTSVYPGYADQLIRGIRMLDRSRILVQDEVSGATVGTSLDWRMLTEAYSISLSEDGKTATLSDSGKKLRVDILEGDGTFEVLLPPDPVDGEYANDDAQILNINYTLSSTDHRLVVLLTPEGESWSELDDPIVSDMDSW